MKKISPAIIVILIVVIALLVIKNKEANSPQQSKDTPVVTKGKYTSNSDLKKEDFIRYLNSHGEVSEASEGIYDNSYIDSFADFPFFVLFAVPAGPSGNEIIPFYIKDGELKKADLSFVTHGSAGIWSSYGYNKEKNFFYQAEGMPSDYSYEKGVPCSFTKFTWDMNKLQFTEIEKKSFYSRLDDFCSDEFLKYGIKVGND